MFKVLLATDGSAVAASAAEYAAELCEKIEDADITALFVKDPLPEAWGMMPMPNFSPEEMETITGDMEEQYDKVAARVLHFTQKTLEKHGLKVNLRSEWGNAVASICDTTEKGHFDLIVMGSQHLEAPEELPDSVSYNVLKRTQVPVLVIRQAA